MAPVSRGELSICLELKTVSDNKQEAHQAVQWASSL